VRPCCATTFISEQSLPPLTQRLHTDFGTDTRFDNPRAPQIRPTGFDLGRLVEVGVRVRDVYAESSSATERIRSTVDDDAYLGDLAAAVAGELGGKAVVSLRLFLKKLVADVLDRVAGVCVDLVDDDRPYPTENSCDVDTLGDKHRLEGRAVTASIRFFSTTSARTAPAAGRVGRTDHCRIGRDPAGTNRRRQNRGCDVPAADPYAGTAEARHLSALPRSSEGAAGWGAP
jgi:hypothetical protein